MLFLVKFIKIDEETILMKIITNPKKIKEVLERGAEEAIIRKHLEKRLLNGEKLRIKF
ncbi:unnamed protein product, partial [marine sediment metagenome]